MKAYTKYELEQIKNEDPNKYFYYSNEVKFRKLGINLESNDWELPLVHDTTETSPIDDPEKKDPLRDRFACFNEMMHSEKGVTLVDLEGNLIHLQKPDFNPEVIAKRLGNEPKFELQEPGPAPEGLGFTFYLLRILTAGFYGREQYRKYKEAVRIHEEAVINYESGKAKFEQEKMNPYLERKQKFDEHYKELGLMGKDVEKVKAYTISDKSAFEIEDQQASEYATLVKDVAFINEKRKGARDRLEFLMGPKRAENKERDEAIKDKIIKECYLEKHCFEAEGGSEKNKLRDVEYPEDTGFTDHEIALLGFAATCSPDIWAKVEAYPIPGGPRVMSDEQAKEEAIENAPLWYNYTEAIFARYTRNSTGMVPYINHSKIAVADALKDYKNGDCTALGKILKEAINCCTKHTMLLQDPKDDSRFVDYCLYTKEMLQLMNKNEKLAEAVKNAGLSQEELDEAKISCNFGEVFERGVNAKDALLNNHNLTADEKMNAAADVIGMRLVQKMCNDHFQEFTNADAYTERLDYYLKLGKAKIDEANEIPFEKRGGEEFKALMEESTKATFATSQLTLGYVSEHYGLKHEFGNEITKVFGDDNSPKEIHDAIVKNVNLDGLKNMSGDRILFELTPSKSQKFLTELAPKEGKAVKNVAEKQKVMENQAGMKM